MVLALLGVVGGAAASPKLIHAFRSNQTNTVQKRLDIWQSSLEIIRDHPIFGVGMDNFTHYYAPPHQAYAPCSGLGYMKAGANDEPCLSHPHNEILDFWLSLGLAGLVAYVWLLWTFLSASRRAWKQSPGLRFPMLLGAAGAMIAGVLHGLVDNSYFLIDLATLFWLLCAYVSWCVSAPDPA